MRASQIGTSRLILRPWRDDDLDALAAMNADPDVMRYFPKTQSREETEASLRVVQAHFAEHGWGPWIVEEKDSGRVVGYVGLMTLQDFHTFPPGVEIMWRLAKDVWGRGYAPEAARAALDYGFNPLGLEEILAFTTVNNAPSRRVMEKIGMTHDPTADFEHPALPEGDPLRPHVLYRIWQRLRRAVDWPRK